MISRQQALSSAQKRAFYLGALPCLSLEPPFNACVTKQVSASQCGETVVPSVGPRLKADGTGIPFLLLQRGKRK